MGRRKPSNHVHEDPPPDTTDEWALRHATEPMIDPEVEDLMEQFAYHFGLDTRMVQTLSHVMAVRPKTAREDMEKLWTDLEDSQRPLQMLEHRIRQMVDGKFAGKGRSEDKVMVLAAKYKLDRDATTKLISVMATREMVHGCDVDKDLEQLNQHMAASNKPSALVCMKLRHLSSGAPVGHCTFGGDDAGQKRSAGGDEDAGFDSMISPAMRGVPQYGARDWTDSALEQRLSSANRRGREPSVVMEATDGKMTNAQILAMLGKLSPERQAPAEQSRSRDRRSDSRQRRGSRNRAKRSGRRNDSRQGRSRNTDSERRQRSRSRGCLRSSHGGRISRRR